MVIPQHAAESLTACDLAGSAAHFVAWFDDPIAEPLMISFSMIEVRNTVPPNTKSVKCAMPGIRFLASRFMFTGTSTNWAMIFVGAGCRARKIGLASKYQHGCWIEPFAPALSSNRNQR